MNISNKDAFFMKPKVAPRPSFHIYFSKVPTKLQIIREFDRKFIEIRPLFPKYHKYENSVTKEIDMKSNTVRAI